MLADKIKIVWPKESNGYAYLVFDGVEIATIYTTERCEKAEAWAKILHGLGHGKSVEGLAAYIQARGQLAVAQERFSRFVVDPFELKENDTNTNNTESSHSEQ